MKPQSDEAESGQALVEFILALTVALGTVFLYIQLCLGLAWGNYVQYATFMSARAYMAAGQNREDQVERAENVLRRMVKRGSRSSEDRLPSIARGEGGGDLRGAEIGPGSEYDANDPSKAWMDGVRYTFRSRLFLAPLGGASANGVTLSSEAWLGREPSYEECVGAMQGAIFDNGC
jgi:hypothetical protein